jgi:AcrR family transcriptional regulator
MGARMAKTSPKPAKRGSKAQTKGAKKRPRRTQHERTAESTQRLTDAAIALIAEKGFNNTTLAEIGERAGYSRSMVQFRFGTKEGFLESLLREEYETRLLVNRPAPGSSGLERVLAQIDLLHDQLEAAPGLMRGFFVLCFEALGPLESLREWLDDWLTRYQEETAVAIRAGIDDGTIRPEVDPEREAAALTASCVGHAFKWTASPERVDFLEAMRATREDVETRLAAKHPRTRSRPGRARLPSTKGRGE